MNILRHVTMTWVLIFLVEGRVVDKFIKSFVENERIPTMVVFHEVCWKKTFKVRLMKELSKAGVRSSSLLPEGTSLQDHTVLLLTDLECPGAAEVFENATHRNLQRLPYRWLALSDTPLDGTAPLWDQFLVDSDLVLAAVDGEGYRMAELHKTARGRPTIVTPRGVFHGTDGTLNDVRAHRELFRRRCDVMGAPMTMINGIQNSNSTIDHILNEDLLELEHDVMSRNGWIYAKTGFLMLNATPVAKFSSNFGYLKKGRWTGSIKDLIDYRGDIGTNVGLTPARLNVVTYIDVMDNSRPRFIFRQPALSLTANIFSLPFSSGIWMATGISTFAAGLAFWLSIKLFGRTAGSDGAMGGNGAMSDEVMRDAFLLTMGAISQQGVEVDPRNVSARIILWVIFTTMMALYAAYSANIVVLLQAPSTSINSLAQLAESKLTLAAMDVEYNHFLFKGGQDPVRNEISRKVDPDKGPKAFYNITEGVEKIRKGQFAMHGLVEPVYRQIEKTFHEPEKCDLVEIDYLGYFRLTAPASKKSPYVELMRVAYRRLREVGIKAAINNRFEVRKPACKDSAAQFTSVGVTELRPVLLLMMYGVALSVGVASMEFLVFHANRFVNARIPRRRLIERVINRRQ